jgi:hypothetical protein
MNLEKVTPTSPKASTTSLSQSAISFQPLLSTSQVLELLLTIALNPVISNWPDVKYSSSWPEVLVLYDRPY